MTDRQLATKCIETAEKLDNMNLSFEVRTAIKDLDFFDLYDFFGDLETETEVENFTRKLFLRRRQPFFKVDTDKDLETYVFTDFESIYNFLAKLPVNRWFIIYDCENFAIAERMTPDYIDYYSNSKYFDNAFYGLDALTTGRF